MTGPLLDGGPDGDRRARLVLSRLVEPGSWPLQAAVSERGAVEVTRCLLEHRAVPGLSARLREVAAERAQAYGRAGLDVDLRRLDRVCGRLVCPGDPEWPGDRLVWGPVSDDKLAAPPLSLFVRGGGGALDALLDRSVAVVGARAATAYGQSVAGELGLGLAERGVTVLSGGAYGIDAAAHRGALAGDDGRTAAVLACGVDVAYPRGNDRLIDRVAERGLVVSEHPPGATPTRLRFLVRNRLIAALSTGTVVVEAAARSGSLSTANRARDLHRVVMAVPGPVTSTLSIGCHELIRDGVTLVSRTADVLELVGRIGEAPAPVVRGEQRVRDDLPAAVQLLLDALPTRGGAGAAALARKTGLTVLAVQQVLPPLMVNGLVRRSETGWVLTPLGAGKPAKPPERQ